MEYPNAADYAASYGAHTKRYLATLKRLMTTGKLCPFPGSPRFNDPTHGIYCCAKQAAHYAAIVLDGKNASIARTVKG